MLMNKQSKKRKRAPTPTPTPTPTPVQPAPLLPIDVIVTHILPKVPVRSLLRFSLVSKHWYSTIHDPKFPASHLTHAKSNPSLVAMFCRKARFICFLQFIEGGDGNLPNSKIPYLELDSGSSHIVGIGNGLSCHIIRSAVQICNPCTRELLNIPLPEPVTLIERNASVRNAFGFDPLRSEYKVLNVWTNYHDYYDCRVYTLGTNTWRDVTTTCKYQPCIADFTPICINGTLYWRTNQRGSILSFDLHCETFRLLAGPVVLEEWSLHTLFESEGRLSLVYRHDDRVQLTLFSRVTTSGDAEWMMLPQIIGLPLLAEIKQVRFVEFAKDVYVHWVTRDGDFILFDVQGKRKIIIHDKVVLLGMKEQWVFLDKHVENFLSLETFAGAAGARYFSSDVCEHERPTWEDMKHRNLKNVIEYGYDELGIVTTNFWLSLDISTTCS